jgi:hypothetical protein
MMTIEEDRNAAEGLHCPTAQQMTDGSVDRRHITETPPRVVSTVQLLSILHRRCVSLLVSSVDRCGSCHI